jgi:hypothetical protein
MAQARFTVCGLANKLEDMGTQVKFAFHPVAGKMPGHVNVLLAEADAAYEKPFEINEINPEFKDTELTMIIGACDEVNPAAISVEDTPISGMPILMAHEAGKVVACNLDENPGYSGVENPSHERRHRTQGGRNRRQQPGGHGNTGLPDGQVITSCSDQTQVSSSGFPAFERPNCSPWSGKGISPPRA